LLLRESWAAAAEATPDSRYVPKTLLISGALSSDTRSEYSPGVPGSGYVSNCVRELRLSRNPNGHPD
jgi:hypothetical protein